MGGRGCLERPFAGLLCPLPALLALWCLGQNGGDRREGWLAENQLGRLVPRSAALNQMFAAPKVRVESRHPVLSAGSRGGLCAAFFPPCDPSDQLIPGRFHRGAPLLGFRHCGIQSPSEQGSLSSPPASAWRSFCQLPPEVRARACVRGQLEKPCCRGNVRAAGNGGGGGFSTLRLAGRRGAACHHGFGEVFLFPTAATKEQVMLLPLPGPGLHFPLPVRSRRFPGAWRAGESHEERSHLESRHWPGFDPLLPSLSPVLSSLGSLQCQAGLVGVGFITRWLGHAVSALLMPFALPGFMWGGGLRSTELCPTS